MHFASPLPWWLAVVVAAGIAGVAVYSYWRPLVPLTAAQRGVLTALRALSLAVVAFFIARPVLLLPPVGSGDVVIPVLVDASRSMRVNDADGETRIARAADVIRRTIAPGLATHGTIELLEFGKSGSLLTPATVDSLSADGRRTELADAVQAARDRYRGRRVAGIVVLTDGAETNAAPTDRPPASQGPPVFAIGIGSPEGIPDREVASISAGDPRLDQSLVDLHVSTVSHGFGRAPFQLRVLGNGQVLETRRVVPLADGSPVDETFSVSPDPANPTVFTAEVVADENDTIAENNARSVLVSPAARKRRILVIAGAPGFEHSFLVRALAIDPGLEVDSIVRKGKNDQNQDTFLVQAPANRVNALTGGFPATREALFDYDALVIANLEADFFTRAQLGLAAEFVGVRGGGVLVLGGRSFESRGMIGTPLEEVLPVELNDRHGSPVTAPGEDGVATQNVITPTPDGVNHPVMRIAATADASRKAWSGAAGALGQRRGRRPETRRERPRGDDHAERCGHAGNRGAALRTRAVDGVWGRGLVALEDDAAVHGSQLRVLLAAVAALADRRGARAGLADADPGSRARRRAGRRRRSPRSRIRAGCRRGRRGGAHQAGRRSGCRCRCGRWATGGSRPQRRRTLPVCTACTLRRGAARRVLARRSAG